MLHAFETYAGDFVTSNVASEEFVVALRRHSLINENTALPIIYDGDVVPGVAGRLRAQDGVSELFAPGQCMVRTDAGHRLSELVAEPLATIPCLDVAILHLLDTLLAQTNRYLLHGAALSLPHDPSRAIVIFAPSGRGKTTAALALADNGFALLSDDAVVVQTASSDCEQCSVWGLPRPAKVHHQTAELLPRIAQLLRGAWDNEGEQALSIDVLRCSGHAAQPRAATSQIAAIFILKARAQADHNIVPIAKADAVLDIASDNVRLSIQGADQHRFEAISRLASTVPAFALHVGTPLSTLERAVRKAIGVTCEG
jgi:hypothetical protein